MLTNSKTGNTGVNGNNENYSPDSLKAEVGTGTHKAASANIGSQESLLRARRNIQGAQEAALGAVNRFYQESEAAERKAEKMVHDLEEVIQTALDITRKTGKANEHATEQDGSQPVDDESYGSIADIKAAIADDKAADKQVNEEVYRLLTEVNPPLRKFIDDLVEEKSRVHVEKINTEAKSEIIAARIAVNKAQEEINAAKEEAKRAAIENEGTQKATELLISQVKQDAVSQYANEIARAHKEVKAIKEAAHAAILKAEEEIRKNREEATTLNDYVTETLSLAQDKVKRDSDELKAYKQHAQTLIRQAQEEAKKAKEEAEEIRREARVAIGKAAQESKQAKSDMELAKRTVQEAGVSAEKQAYDRFCEELKKMRAEVDVNNNAARQAVVKAQEEAEQAKQELEAVKKLTEKELNIARAETIKARKEADAAKQTINEAISQAQEEARKAKEEAEKTIVKANEVIIQAKKDIINMTRSEIVKARQELQSPGKVAKSADKAVEPAADVSDEPVEQGLDSGYFASVLHEMRNPLHSISGFAKLMLEEDVADEKTRKEFLNNMVQQSESLNKLIDDMSQALNDKNKAFDVNKDTVAPDEVIVQAVDSVKEMARQKKNIISYDHPPLPEIKADGFRVKQVLVNLLTNAIKFSPNGSTISVNATTRKNELLVQVIDQGIGIPKADIPLIFDVHYQGRNHGDVEGDGFGLFICKQIVESHGGRIWVKSVEGEGSIFSFSLPLATVGQ